MTRPGHIRARHAVMLVGAAALIWGAAGIQRGVHAIDPGVVSSTPPVNATSGDGRLLDVGPTPGDRAIEFELVLDVPGREAMLAYARDVGDPASPAYRQFLSADEIGARFGLADADIERLTSWAAGHALTVTATAPQRLAISLSASARTIEAVFRVALRDYADARGRTFHAPAGAAILPAELDGLVTSVAGLDARPTDQPAWRGPIAAGPRGGMTPSIIDKAYELDGLRALGLHGEGQTVAIVSLDTFDPADVAAYDRMAGTSGPAIQRVAVSGGVAKPGDDQVEVDLDIDVIRAVAPKAQIIDYEAPNKGGAIAVIVDRIVQDHKADIASISWGSCEPNRAPDAISRLASSMAAAAAAGITVFVASGDHGAYGCIDNNREDLQVAVDSPASDVNVVAVGGTYASMLDDGTYIDEVAWEDPLTGWAPGGGVSTVNRRPAWQVGLGVDNARSNGMRQVPDVAAPADPQSGFLTVSGGEASSGGGTSAASPFWAAYAALVRQLAAKEGQRGLGALGPTLYAVAAAQPAGAVFHDVTRGGNLFDNAATGWDYATGLGTPRGMPLARAIVDYVKSH